VTSLQFLDEVNFTVIAGPIWPSSSTVLVALRFSYAEGVAENSWPFLNDLTARRYGFGLSEPSLLGIGGCDGAEAPLEDGLSSLAGGFSAIERLSDGIISDRQVVV
jgi:hypothetical protein